MVVPSNPYVHMETVETAEDEETEPDKTGDTGIFRKYGGKQPERVLERLQYDNGQEGTIKRKTDTVRLL